MRHPPFSMPSLLIVFLSAAAASLVKATCTPAKTKQFDCGVRGRVRSPHYWPYAFPQILESTEACAALCARRVREYGFDAYYFGECLSFNYNPKNKLCQLGIFSLPKGSVVQSSPDPGFYYDVKCFHCGRYCDQPYGENLIDNGDFELPLAGPWFGDHVSIDQAPDGRKAFHCKLRDNDGERSCEIAQGFNICRGNIYTGKGNLYAADFDYLLIPQNRSDKSSFTVSWDSKTRLSSDDPNHLSWKSHRLYFNSSLQTHGQIHFSARLAPGAPDHSTPMDLYVTNVRAMHVPRTPPLADPKHNFIGNPGFETGELEPWYAASQHRGGELTVVSPGLNNSTYAALVSSSPRPPRLVQNVQVKAGSSYLFSFDASFPPQAYKKMQYALGPEGEVTTFREFDPYFNKTYCGLVKFNSNSTSIFIRMVGYQSYSYWEATFDNFRLLEIQKTEFFS